MFSFLASKTAIMGLLMGIGGLGATLAGVGGGAPGPVVQHNSLIGINIERRPERERGGVGEGERGRRKPRSPISAPSPPPPPLSKPKFPLLDRILYPASASVENWGSEGSCAWAVAAGILNYRAYVAEQKGTPESLAAAEAYRSTARWVRQTKRGGTSLEFVAAELARHGYRARPVNSMGDIEAAIAAGDPVGYRINRDGGSVGHAITLIDLTATEATYVDPNYPAVATTISRRDFERDWNQGGRSGMTVSKVNEVGVREKRKAER